MPHEQDLFGPWAWSEATYWSELAAPGRWYRVAHNRHDDLVGWVGLAVAGGEADVQTIAVTEAGRGQGVGFRLMGELLRQAHVLGASRVMLEVRADNEPAKKLYAKCGFDQFGVRPRYYQPGDVDALLLRVRVREALELMGAPVVDDETPVVSEELA